MARRFRSVRKFRRELRQIARLARRSWRLVPVRRRWALGGAVLVMGISSAANTAVPLLIGALVNAVAPATRGEMPRSQAGTIAALYLAAIGAAYLLREAAGVTRRYLGENAVTKINKDLYIRVLNRIMMTDLARLAYDQVGSLHNRINRSVDGLVRFLRLCFLDFIPAILTGFFALGAALVKEPRIALAMAGVAPLSIFLTVWQLYTQKDIRLGLMRTRERMDGTVVEQLGGIEYVRAANTRRREVRRVASAAERLRTKEIRHHFEMSLFGAGKALNEGIFHLLVIAFAVYLFIGGQIQEGDVLTFSVLYLSVMAPLNEIHRFLDEAHESSLKIGDLMTILSEPVDRSFRPVEPREPVVSSGAPLFVTEGLVADYRLADGSPRRALHGVTMEIRHGETIGVAGRSGCGKTTWLKVLMRLTHPTGGAVTVGGLPLDCLSRDAIGELIGYVGQNPFVFSGTIAENIAYDRDDASPEQIRRAAEQACLHDEIMMMPGGYKARVSERGQNLSGGQRQRLALARVFLKNPPLLILDEGTSALDNISERHIQRAIRAAMADRTVILVAHRLTTLRDADRILVFDDGRIVETGTYAALVRGGGVFARLVQSAEEAGPEGPDLDQPLGLDGGRFLRPVP